MWKRPQLHVRIVCVGAAAAERNLIQRTCVAISEFVGVFCETGLGSLHVYYSLILCLHSGTILTYSVRYALNVRNTYTIRLLPALSARRIVLPYIFLRLSFYEPSCACQLHFTAMGLKR